MGGPLYSVYELPNDVSRILIDFKSVGSAFRQALHLKARGGELEINGTEAADFAVWHDTAPSSVEVIVRWRDRSRRSLRIWNSWEYNGVVHSWLGNAGMRVDQLEPGRLLLRCSDGIGDPKFDDLVVELAME